ncbi:DUF6503 family protein [uncultured Cyclobacterium sp.]|uniref:DUF6503 family protein n=1 Tax=uncultured Cyclobacterium sp. TaxID=453820 RepID=UPI0030EF6CC7|tara:strand:- start:18925 stop:19734 length:810 start_codon:yes stop_codon:yes gene_type:complete
MNKLVILVLLFAFVACQEKSQKQKTNEEGSLDVPMQEMTLKEYPVDFAKVLEAHGGIDQWRKEKTLRYEIGAPGEGEQQIIDLHRRMDKTITTDYELGFDGEKAWSLNKEGEYKGNPLFRHNLMFYFYAMPFVLADPGLNYEATEDKEILGTSYSGIKVTFNSGVGDSSSDEYYLYYDKETYQMTWLAYKATFGSEKKPEWANFISYDNWDLVDGILLPTSVAWHTVEEGVVGEERNRVNFNNISLSKEAKPEGFYSVPANAVVVQDEK